MARTKILGACLLALLFQLACGLKPEPLASKPDQRAPISPEVEAAHKAIEKEPWVVEWERLVQEARREGRVVMYTAAGAEATQALREAFRQKYGIALESISGRAGEMLAKVIAERKAGLYFADILIGGSTSLALQYEPRGLVDPIGPLLLRPDVLDSKVWFDERLPLVGNGTGVAFASNPSFPYAINTNLVKPEEVQSYRQLLNPKWKGKMSMDDPTISGKGASWFAVVGWEFMDLDFMQELAKQEPVIIIDRRLQIEWLAKGKHLVAISARPEMMTLFKNAGAPVDEVYPREGVELSAGAGIVSIFNRAAHPNAAKLFINWLLTKEGLLVWSKVRGTQTARADVPPEHLDPKHLRQKGIKYYDTTSDEFIRVYPERVKVAREIFGHLLK